MSEDHQEFSRDKLGPIENAQHREMWWWHTYQKAERLRKAAKRRTWIALLSVAGTLAVIASAIRDLFFVKN